MTQPIAKVSDIIFIRFQLRDLEAQAAYLEDFGMTPVHKSDEAIFYRGTGTDAYIYAAEKGDIDAFIAAAYETDSLEALQALAASQGA